MLLLIKASLISQLLLMVVPLTASANLFSTEFLKEPRIINGFVAPEDRYPYSVSMRDFRGHFCGGTLIGNDVVLTAAHCLINGAPGSVAIGSDNVDSGEKIAVASALKHPKYNTNNDNYDIALVFLRESTSHDIAMPKLNRDSSFPSAGRKAVTMGWGKTDANTESLPDELLAVELDVISNSVCEDASRGGYNYRGDIYDSMMCTSTTDKDACQGDSGGPLVIQSEGDDPTQDVLIGIVSWGVGCAYLPGVFARVSEGMEWIEETVCDRSNDSPGSLCGPDERTEGLATKVPTRFPTRNPTKTPTESPTISPTNSPTTSPTASPSSSPTTSIEPTEQPSDPPSISLQPTDMPSISTSPTISTQPTESPSVSSKPTSAPTTLPSISLNPTVSQRPSSTPSLRPSGQPSSQPSLQPTSQPSEIPSQSPSTSISPSAQPSLAPSSGPSSSPTISAHPTLTSSPSISAAPTLKPVEVEAERKIPGTSLLISESTTLADDENIKSNSSNRSGCSFVMVAVLSGIITAWLVL